MRPASKGDSSRLAYGRTTLATGRIQGTVTDPAGAVVRGAKVTITGTATCQVITAATRAAGAIGIADLTRPDFGDTVTVRAGEVPVFWACGVTPQAVLMEAKPEFAITHSPGCMFVTGRLAEDIG